MKKIITGSKSRKIIINLNKFSVEKMRVKNNTTEFLSVTELSQNESKGTVTFSDGSQDTADLIVCAGLGSTNNKLVFEINCETRC